MTKQRGPLSSRDAQHTMPLIREDVLDTLLALAAAERQEFDPKAVAALLCTQAVELTPASAATVTLAWPDCAPEVVASSTNAACDVTQWQWDHHTGPAPLSYRTGAAAADTDARITEQDRADLTAALTAAGFSHARALPMRRRDETLGVLTLYAEEANPAWDMPATPQAMADAAAIGLAQGREIHRLVKLAAQLQSALDSRIVIEQAKGIIAERFGWDLGHAFQVLRHYARAHNYRLADVCHNIIQQGRQPS